MIAISQNLKSFILLPLVFITCFCWGQKKDPINRDNYSLLWEISKDGKSSKSYLFGTIHLKDKELFQFPDQLVPALKSVDAFAMEVHPDSISFKLLSEVISPDYKPAIKALLSKEELEKLDTELQSLGSKPLDSLDIFNFEILQDLVYRQLAKDDDVDYIIDTYLFELAKVYKKERFGLEKLEDQIEITEKMYQRDDSTAIKKDILEFLDGGKEVFFSFVREMKDLYIAGDSQKLYAYSLDDKFKEFDFQLEERNIKMARVIDSILQHKTLFSAVGAAHLRGEKGLVTLLENKGYTLTPVAATFNNTELEEIPVQFNSWKLFDNPDLRYQVKVPNTPEKSSGQGNRLFNMSFDLLNEHMYMFGVIVNPVKSNPGLEFIKGMNQGGNGYTLKDSILTEDHKIYKAEVNNGEGIFRIETHEKFNNLYVFAAMDDEFGNVYNPYINHFFESIAIVKPKVTPTQFKLYRDTAAGFQTSYLSDFKKFDTEVANPLEPDGEPYQMHIVNGVDNKNGTSYLMRNNDFPLGYFLEHEIKAAQEYKSNLEARRFVVKNDTIFKRNGKKIIQFSVLVPEREFSGKIEIYYRGNRSYMLFALSENKTDEFDENIPFFQDFEYLPLQSNPFETKKDSLHKILFQFPPKYETTYEDDATSEFKDFTIHVGKDMGTGGCYLVSVAKFKPYFYSKDIDTYVENLIKESYMVEKDSIISKEIVASKDRKVYKYHMQSPFTNIQKYYQITIKDNLFVSKFAYVGKEELALDGFKYFTGPVVFPKTKRFSIDQSKTRKILANLKAKDTTTFKEAKNALYYYLFDNEDADAIVEALPVAYPDDSLEYDSTRFLLLQNLYILKLEEEQVKKLKEVYQSDALSTSFKAEVVSYFPDSIAYRGYLREMIQKLPIQKEEGEVYSSEIFNAFTTADSLSKKDVDFLIELLSRKDLKRAVSSVIADHIKNTAWLQERISPKLSLITEEFKNNIIRYQQDIKTDSTAFVSYDTYSYLRIFEALDAEQLAPYQDDIATVFEIQDAYQWIASRTLLLFIDKGWSYPKSFFDRKIEDLYSRFEVMEALIKSSRMAEIPEAYLTPENFTELSAYFEVVEQYDVPENIQKLGSIPYENRTFNVYEVTLNDTEKESYLVYTELLEPNLANFQLNPSYLDWESDVKNWEESATNFIKNDLRESP